MAKKTCFIVTPIGDENSQIRRAADGVIDAVISPVMENLGFKIDVAHRMSDAGSITKQVISKLIESDLVICNLTSLNPNVMYELAVRHAIRKPIICIAEKGTKIPFDIQEDRIIFYDNDMLGATTLSRDLKNTIPKAEIDNTPDNPIYRAIESQTIIKQVSAEGGLEKYIVNSIDKLERMIGNIASGESNIPQKNRREYNVEITLHKKINVKTLTNIISKLQDDFPTECAVIDQTNDSLLLTAMNAESANELKSRIRYVLQNHLESIEEINVYSH